jgi:hypothetical protein
MYRFSVDDHCLQCGGTIDTNDVRQKCTNCGRWLDVSNQVIPFAALPHGARFLSGHDDAGNVWKKRGLGETLPLNFDSSIPGSEPLRLAGHQENAPVIPIENVRMIGTVFGYN